MSALIKPGTVTPITLGKFTLTEVGITVQGKPTFDEWQTVGDFVKRTHKAVGFWLADWLRYGDSRRDWAERLGQALDSTELSAKTLINIRSVARVAPETRRPGVEFSHHVEVAKLPKEEQEEWLEKAEINGWSVRDLRNEMRASRRRLVIQGQATLEGRYRVIYADPSWRYNDSGATEDGSLGKAERHYPTMSIEELCALPVAAHVLPNAVLFMWTTAPIILQNPGPREVGEAWGFTYKGNFVWDKELGMPGHYNHVVHEHLLVFTRGDGTPDVKTPMPKSLFKERRGEHSAKPAAIRKMIERMYTTGPYLEMFAREKTPGWSTFGNDPRLWGSE